MKMLVKPLSDIWTGGIVTNECKTLRTSGIMGSLRWWYELAVRALDGYACSPVDEGCACPGFIDNNKVLCPVCELFGTTGWARKFKLRIEDKKGDPVQEQLKKGEKYWFSFIFMKPTAPEEKWLLARVISRVVAPYGGIGGKMTNKPSEHAFSMDTRLVAKQNRIHHQDFGLFEVYEISGLPDICPSKQGMKEYCLSFQKPQYPNMVNDWQWPKLTDLFVVRGKFSNTCLDRIKMNELLGIEPKNQKAAGASLKGDIGISNKIFSFKKDRIWGYCRDNKERETILNEIVRLLNSDESVVCIDGSQLLDAIFD